MTFLSPKALAEIQRHKEDADIFVATNVDRPQLFWRLKEALEDRAVLLGHIRATKDMRNEVVGECAQVCEDMANESDAYERRMAGDRSWYNPGGLALRKAAGAIHNLILKL